MSVRRAQLRARISHRHAAPRNRRPATIGRGTSSKPPSASDFLITGTPDEMQQATLGRILSQPDSVFVGHVPEREAFPGVGARLQRFADSAGYHRQMLQTVFDSNGRPVFEIFRFVR